MQKETEDMLKRAFGINDVSFIFSLWSNINQTLGELEPEANQKTLGNMTMYEFANLVARTEGTPRFRHRKFWVKFEEVKVMACDEDDAEQQVKNQFGVIESIEESEDD